MFDACDFLAVLVFVGSCRLMLDKLRAAFWMLAFAETRKVLGSNRAFETPLLARGYLATRCALAGRGSSSSVSQT